MLNTDIGGNIQKYREIRKMSQADLADRVDVRQTTISYIERGMRVPSTPLLVIIAQTLGVSLDEIVYGEKAAEK